MDLISAVSESGFSTIDLVIVVLYLCVLVFLGIFFGRTKSGGQRSANDYFLAGRNLTWWAVGASLIAANISAEQFIGMSGTSYADGIATAAYELMAAVTLLVIGKFLLPVLIRQKIYTMPQFLRHRYNDGVGVAFSILWLFLYVFVNLTSVSWLGALAIEQILGLQGVAVQIGGLTVSVRMLIVVALFAIAGMYSIYGGLASVAWTDVLQVTFLVGGGLVTAFVALKAVGGDAGAFAGLGNIFRDLTTGEHLTDSHLHLVVQQSHNASAFGNVPGIAAVVGGVWLTNIGYWGFNQYITQKGLAAKSIDEAQKGIVFAAFLKILIPFIVCLPGICAYYVSIHPEMMDGLKGSINVADDAYPWLVRNFTPTGIKGLTFAALAAAIISSLASMLNSTSTLFAIDIYKKYLGKDSSEKKIVKVGRLASLCALFIALFAVKPLMGNLDQAFQYIQEYSGFIYPGVVVVFGMGFFWRRASARAAVWTALATIPMGVLFKIFLSDVPFQFRAGYIFITLLLLFVVISLIDSSKTEACSLPSEADRATMHKWAKILGYSGIFFILAAAVVTVWGSILPQSATPENNFIAYLNDIGFQAFFFFGALVGSSAIWLYGDAESRLRDPKALPVDLTLFRTGKAYKIGACFVLAIVTAMYVILW